MKIDTWQLHLGNCKELIKDLEDNSIDSIVTDPPYELGFMGKKWDNSGIAYDVDLWIECLRVLKPGGHLLAFSGSRTYHRMAVAIEDSGFDIRDQIMWIYGSGFPKSHNIGKAIDKTNGEMNRKQKFTEYMRSTGIKAKQIDEATGTIMGLHYIAQASQHAIPTPEIWSKIRPLLQNVPQWVDDLIKRMEAEREILETKHDGGNRGVAILGTEAKDYNITAPATEAAKEWNGWGTALKPAHEPICVARKPLIGTVAENVLQYGTGGINIDGCRVFTDESWQRLKGSNDGLEGNFLKGKKEIPRFSNTNGRWPANLIHDGSEEVLSGFPESISTGGKTAGFGSKTNPANIAFGDRLGANAGGLGDRGSAARFFYCAKASKKDRNEGCEGMDIKQHQSGMRNGMPIDDDGQNRDRFVAESQNHHPTVKPTDLMRYLCRLVTPPKGIILDPFTGSGSTGKAAILEGFRFLGFDMQSEYIDIATARIKHAEKIKDNKLFD